MSFAAMNDYVNKPNIVLYCIVYNSHIFQERHTQHRHAQHLYLEILEETIDPLINRYFMYCTC